jgi:TPR repeat protein
MRRLIFAACLLIASSASAQLRPEAAYERGLKAYLDGDAATAAQSWAGPAAQGLADAQFALGHLYRTGEGVAADPAVAAAWFARAAAQGHPHAMLNLALLIEQGQGVSRDLGLAYAYAARAGRQLQGEEFERARTAATRIAAGFTGDDAERARRLLLEMDRRPPAAAPKRP